MIIKFFSNGIGGGAAPVNYLIAEEVLAYDENRNLIRDEDGTPQTIIRDPLPDVLRGIPDQTRDLIDASSNKWTTIADIMALLWSSFFVAFVVVHCSAPLDEEARSRSASKLLSTSQSKVPLGV